MKKIGLVESIQDLLSFNSFEEFMNEIKQEEYLFYDTLVKKYNEYDNEHRAKADELDATQPGAFRQFINNLYAISEDYDISNFSDIINKYGIERYNQKLDKFLEEHKTKLSKSVSKEIGNVNSIERIKDNTYKVTGEKGTCTLTVSPIKTSSSNNVIKTRFKITDVVEKKPEINEDTDNKYIKEWKQKELNGYLEYNKEFWNKIDNYRDNLKAEQSNLDKVINEYIAKTGERPKSKYVGHLGNKEYVDEEINKIAKEFNKANDEYNDYKRRNSFFFQYGKDKDFETRCKKEIDRHFNDLQNRVEQYIGKIINIKSLGGNDYWFEGENGTCTIEVILAGGYNIQRLHTRWIVKNVQNNKEE